MAGASVVGVARRKDALTAWKADAEGQGGTVAACPADVGDLSGIATVAHEIAEPFGPPDILVNAAGVNLRQSADEATLDGWQQTLDLNLSAPYFLAQALIPNMRKKSWGRIVNIASLQSDRAFPNGIAYGASKGGVAQLTRAMAEAWSRHGINCNALGPGFFPTELTKPVFDNDDRASSNAEQTCIGRNGELADLVGPSLFLASAASNYVTGQILFVDGGFTAK